MIQLNQISMRFGQKILFEDVNFQLNQGNRYGVAGSNGSGKSTFLKILSGEVHPEEGEVRFPTETKLGFLKQNHFEFETIRILDTVLMGKPILWEALLEKEKLLALPEIDEKAGHRLGELEMIIGHEDGYEAESTAAGILSGLGIETALHTNTMSTLSGGYKLRVLLAQVLYSQPDLLLLDEPNNHLDIHSIAWLETYLVEYEGAVVVVSHDHTFLNKVATHILDVDYETIKVYKGNYHQFQQAKELEREQKEVEIARQEKKKEELRAFYERFRGQATKARQAVSRKKQLDKMEDIAIKRSSRIAPHFKFTQKRPTGKQVLRVDGLCKKFGDHTVLHQVTFSVARGDRIAVIGPNGIGKSTLLKILTDHLNRDQGSVEWGHEISPGYFAQNHKDVIPPKTSAYEWLHGLAPGESIGKIRGILGSMLFTGDDEAHKKTESLSGGEGARLLFAKLIQEQPNVLLLDEPTNHLDLESIEALEKALALFPGTIILVSHDRHFVQKTATAVLELTTKGYDFFRGTYSEYLNHKGEDHLNRDIAVKKKTGGENKNKDRKDKGKNKNNVQERRQLKKEQAKLEKSIPKREERVQELEAMMVEADKKLAENSIYEKGNEEKLQKLIAEKKKLKQSHEKEMDQWEADHYRVNEISRLVSTMDGG